MGGAGASDTHLLASSIVFSVFFIVSFVFISLIVIISLRTVATSVVDGRRSHARAATHACVATHACSVCVKRALCSMAQQRAGRLSASGQ